MRRKRTQVVRENTICAKSGEYQIYYVAVQFGKVNSTSSAVYLFMDLIQMIVAYEPVRRAFACVTTWEISRFHTSLAKRTRYRRAVVKPVHFAPRVLREKKFIRHDWLNFRTRTYPSHEQLCLHKIVLCLWRAKWKLLKWEMLLESCANTDMTAATSIAADKNEKMKKSKWQLRNSQKDLVSLYSPVAIRLHRQLLISYKLLTATGSFTSVSA